MRAIVVDEPGGPEVLRLEDVEIPQPGPDVIDDRYAVSGGQPAEAWLRTLEAIEAERIS